jgi:zeaxanthin glucosyltransferase
MQNRRILIVTIPEKGHINPMIGIAQYLQAAGFELFFFSQQDISPQLQKAGLHQKVYSDPTAINIKEDFITRGQAFVEQLADKPWLRNWIKTLLIDAVPEQIRLITAAAEDCQPALIVTDPMIYAAAITASQLDIPWVGVSSSLNPITPDGWSCELTDTLDSFSEQRDRLFTGQGLSPRFKVSDLISPWLNLVFSTEEYMPRSVCGNDVSFYTGHSFPMNERGDETDFPFDRLLPHTRKAYMSMGSQIYYHPQLFNAVAKALTADDIQLVFSINELYHTPFLQQLPSSVIAVPYAPQLKVLPYMDLVITHGGANSVMESLANGIPVAMLPICNDQFLQAKFITRAGAGIVLDPEDPSPDIYRQQLLPILQPQSPERIKAHAIGQSFQRHGGAREAAEWIQRLYEMQEPLMPLFTIR